MPSPRTVAAEKSVPAPTRTKPTTTTTPTTTPSRSVGSFEDARAAFERAVEGYDNPNLEVGEVREFSNNYYAEVKEKDTGIGAMELLINRPGNRVYPEPGPNMMWNAKYGMMGGSGGYGGMMGRGGRGMMGRASASASAQPPRGNNTADKMAVGPQQARQIADAYLSRGSRPAPKRSSPSGSTATTP